MSRWPSGEVIANGVRIHYYRTGGDKPPIVVSHGATDSGLCWTRVAEALESDYDVIMPDARGHGLSGVPTDGYGSAAKAADLAGLIRALRLEKPAAMGHSMGADTTLFAASKYPSLLRCAILEDPPLWENFAPPSGGQMMETLRSNFAALGELRKLPREEIINACRKASPTWDEAEFGPWADSKIQLSDNFFQSLFEPGMVQAHGREVLAAIKCPTLLVTSDPERGGIVTPKAAEQVTGVVPSIRAIRLTGAGHNIRREQFEAFVAAVREFLDSVPA